MKKLLLATFCGLIIYLIPTQLFGQVAPDLGSSSNFALFTASGAFNNAGASVVTGDAGTNVGAFNAFPPGVIIGNVYTADPVTAQAATDVAIAYGFVSAMTCGSVIPSTLGNGQTLLPNIYCTGAASTINGDLILDAQGDPGSIFIFQIDGALATTVDSRIILANGASLCNVYWRVNGQVDLGENSLFQGTILADGAINLLDAATLYGQALSVAGAISAQNNLVTIGVPVIASVISTDGDVSICDGESVILSGNIDGVWSTGETGISISVSESGDYFVTNTTNCGSEESNHITIVVNPLPVCSISGDLILCEAESTELCASPGALSYLWSTGATTACILVDQAGIYSVTVTSAAGCESICSAEVIVNPNPICEITGDLFNYEVGQTTQLCASPGALSYLWSTGATTACILVDQAGIYSVTVTSAAGCESICSVEVVVNPNPICEISGDLFICEVGQTTQLCASPGALSYLWSTGATTACILVDQAGIYSVTVTSAAGCESICSAEVVLNQQSECFITGNDLLCLDLSTELCASTGATSYLWSTGETTICIDVYGPGVYSVTLNFPNNCSSYCEKIVNIEINNAPVADDNDTIVLDCYEEVPGNYPTFTDQDGDVLDIVCTEEIVDNLCGYSIVRTCIATDICEASVIGILQIDVPDTLAPVFQEIPDVISVICSEWGPEFYPEALDNCDLELDIELTDFLPMSGLCNQWWLAFLTATDDCGNSTSIEFLVKFIELNGPTIYDVPADVYLNCAEEIPAVPNVYASADCGELQSLEFIETQGSELCQDWITRIWIAVDDCGRTTIQSYNIYLPDGQAPELTGVPADLILFCGDEVPEPAIVTAWDECEGVIDVIFTESIEGELPNEEICNLITPTIQGQDWALTLLNFLGDQTYFTMDEAQFTTWIEIDGLYGNITATLNSTTNPNAGFVLDLDIINGVDWNTWSNSPWPTYYKDDMNLAGDNYLDWTYFIISSSSTLTGWGDYEGSLLNLSHAPESHYYGFQLGEAANNVSAAFGSGGWFLFTGLFIDTSQGISELFEGAGDVAFEHVCEINNCPEYSVVRTWTATDICGNSVNEEQVITILGFIDPSLLNLCIGDINLDGVVNVNDILMFTSVFGCSEGDCEIADLNADGAVNVPDILLLISNYGLICE